MGVKDTLQVKISVKRFFKNRYSEEIRPIILLDDLQFNKIDQGDNVMLTSEFLVRSENYNLGT